MRLLFTSTVGLGHLLPLLPLAQAAAAVGHEVAIASAPRNADRISRLGLQHLAVGEAAEQDRRAVQDPQNPAAGPTAVFGRLNPLATLPRMRAIVAAWRPDVVVSEAAEFSGGIVADLHGLPTVRVHPGMAGVGAFETLVASSLSQIRTELGLPADPDGRRLREGPQISYFPEAFDLPSADSRNVCRVRPAPPTGFVGEREPTVYVTFGTEVVGAPFFPALVRDAVGAVQKTGHRVLMSIGSADPGQFADLDAVRIESWIDQATMLPRVKAVICHAGAGTILGALAAGTPVVAIPFFADQPFNAERIAATRTGVVVQPGDDLRDRLGGALEEILSDPPQGCRPMAEAIRAMPGLDAATDLIEGVVQSHGHSWAGTRLREVVEVVSQLQKQDCRVWVAGGWGVDALARRQTRPHRDLDLAVDAQDQSRALDVLQQRGYRVRTNALPFRVELHAPGKGWVDLHPVSIADASGQGPDPNEEEPFALRPDAFAEGVLAGQTVPCLSVAQQLRFHQGYELRPVDLHDTALLQTLEARAEPTPRPKPSEGERRRSSQNPPDVLQTSEEAHQSPGEPAPTQTAPIPAAR